MSKLKNILEGWSNYLNEKPEVEALAKTRAEVCATCPHAIESTFAELVDFKPEPVKGMVCAKCSCPLTKKIRSPHETCPEKLWTA